MANKSFHQYLEERADKFFIIAPRIIEGRIMEHKYGDVLFDVFSRKVTGHPDSYTERAYSHKENKMGNRYVLAASLKGVKDSSVKLMFRVRAGEALEEPLEFLIYQVASHPLNIFLPIEPKDNEVKVREEDHLMSGANISLDILLAAADIVKTTRNSFRKKGLLK